MRDYSRSGCELPEDQALGFLSSHKWPRGTEEVTWPWLPPEGVGKDPGRVFGTKRSDRATRG